MMFSRYNEHLLERSPLNTWFIIFFKVTEALHNPSPWSGNDCYPLYHWKLSSLYVSRLLFFSLRAYKVNYDKRPAPVNEARVTSILGNL